MNKISIVAKYLTDNSELLAIKIVDDILQRLEIELPKEELTYYNGVYTEFIELLAESITLNENKVPHGFIEMSKKMESARQL